MKKLIYPLMAALVVLAGVSCTKLLDTDDLSSGDEEGYVDMGLSVKWRNRNAGAGCPQEKGDFYTYQDMKTKFDNIPTKEQAEELIANCTVKRASLRGKPGVILTSKITNNTIFFPYGGLYNGEYVKGKDSYIWTITADTSGGWEGLAWFLYFSQVLYDKEYPDGVQYDVSTATVDLKLNVRQVK